MRHGKPRRVWIALLLTGVLAACSSFDPAPMTWTNSIGMEFVKIPAWSLKIPAWSFLMGTKDTDTIFGRKKKEGDDDERPQHRVIFRQAFYLGKYEVTQEQWEVVMGNNPSRFKGRGNPVENVSWNDVQVFIQRLNEKEGTNKYRLPTEAEWEYAARAGTATRYSFGDDADRLGRYAWYHSNSGNQTHPVGQKQPNPWGLYDMYGNVWEWVQDWYDKTYYTHSPADNPTGPSSGVTRVLRGGSWGAGILRSAYRSSRSPGLRDEHSGFRLAHSPGPP
jgi:formylglycine-generating enzyme required for sulfatase activity